MWDLFITAAIRTVVIIVVVAAIIGLAIGLAQAVIATYFWLGWSGIIILAVIFVFIIVLVDTYIDLK